MVKLGPGEAGAVREFGADKKRRTGKDEAGKIRCVEECVASEIGDAVAHPRRRFRVLRNDVARILLLDGIGPPVRRDESPVACNCHRGPIVPGVSALGEKHQGLCLVHIRSRSRLRAGDSDGGR
jgi:hypothetical protein